MMNLMNTADYANMAVMLAEDVCAPELRSPVFGSGVTNRKMSGVKNQK